MYELRVHDCYYSYILLYICQGNQFFPTILSKGLSQGNQFVLIISKGLSTKKFILTSFLDHERQCQRKEACMYKEYKLRLILNRINH